LDALVQIKNSQVIQIFIVLYIVSAGLFKFFGVSITRVMTAVHRTIIDTFRIICIWGVELFIYYVIKLPNYGADWNNWYFLELGGLVFLIVGTILYNHEVFEIHKDKEPIELYLDNHFNNSVLE